jgi:hypothetical protein
MNYTKTEGCKAAVSSDWEYDRGTYRLTARMVCGERNNIVVGSFGREIFDMNTSYNQARTEEKVSKDMSEALGAMCLGCPYNTAANESIIEVDLT